ncbi:1-deoxy-D-xylulose-5-phosphate synthase [Syntrophobotulus glycolicus DSM 8271]|uniref:1-deoxy-D-xylulose-5-phosphate synthase n=1 Tax=Syntrophobotulus glycolicus (strain DSM 8271 / FlGlyR) TaxID=645991 RepID=F0T096_SYNGF|nr:1-deoxy-D-xylulose-5-phosphate synthase [Syntrophobotulus glycolicus DSM 8271]
MLDTPDQIKELSLEQLKILSEEIRQEMINVVSENGGHLASNLGVVELTIALHRVLTIPEDKIIWDVGHQTYIHKLLTSRREEFKTLRQHKGLSGFPKRSESSCDCFDTGHSSTSISAAVGYAKARDIQNEKYRVVAVIGDGAMSGGMAFEALNHAGNCKTNLIVVLNDNDMFISQNVGAMSSYLNRIRTAPAYDRKKEDIQKFLKNIPKIGNAVAKAAEKAKDGIKYMLVPGMLFEELGLTYLGPVDGHDIASLEKVLTQAKKKKGPVLVHVLTCKGKGYEPARQNPDIFHGIGPFNKENGELKKKSDIPTYTQVFGKTVCELADKDEKIVAVTAAMGSGTGLSHFGKLFPKRYFDVGIAEQHAVTFAAALAFGGLKPIVSMYSTFYQRAYDQVIHDVCLQKAKVIFAVDRAGIVGEDGPTHHGVFDLSFLRAIPNLTIMAPKDEQELRDMFYTALSFDNPVAIRYPRASGVGVPIKKEFSLIEKGKAELLLKGEDLTIIGFGHVVNMCLEAAYKLRMMGINAGVVNLRFINPLDKELIIEQGKLTGKILTVEDHILNGGMGSAVLELLHDENLGEVRVGRIGYRGYVEHGPIPLLHKEHGISMENIIVRATALVHEQEAENQTHIVKEHIH